jgi:UDP-glucose 4-epimerase
VVAGDVRDIATVRRAADGCTVVMHQAALPSVPRSIDSPHDTLEVNALGTLNVLCAARDAGVRRLVYASSSSVYGDSPVLPAHEALPPAPRSPYAASKLAGEAYCQAFAGAHKLETVALRYFNVFGPRQDHRSPYANVVPSFTRAMLNGGSPVVHGDGRQTRDFTYVDDAVDANLLAIRVANAAGSVYNVGSGHAVSLLELLGELERLTGRSAEPVHEPPRAGDVRDTHADLSRANAELDYRPAVAFDTGLARAVAHYGRVIAERARA